MTYEVKDLGGIYIMYLCSNVPSAKCERIDSHYVNVTVPDSDSDLLTDYLDEAGYEYRMI